MQKPCRTRPTRQFLEPRGLLVRAQGRSQKAFTVVRHDVHSSAVWNTKASKSKSFLARFLAAWSSLSISFFVISSLVLVAAPIADLTCTAMYLS